MREMIKLNCPVGSEKVRSGFGQWRTVFIYKCSAANHIVRFFANAFRGKTPIPSTGAITCPQCDFEKQYPRQ